MTMTMKMTQKPVTQTEAHTAPAGMTEPLAVGVETPVPTTSIPTTGGTTTTQSADNEWDAMKDPYLIAFMEWEPR